jgi:hypothetical protein
MDFMTKNGLITKTKNGLEGQEAGKLGCVKG